MTLITTSWVCFYTTFAFLLSFLFYFCVNSLIVAPANLQLRRLSPFFSVRSKLQYLQIQPSLRINVRQIETFPFIPGMQTVVPSGIFCLFSAIRMTLRRLCCLLFSASLQDNWSFLKCIVPRECHVTNFNVHHPLLISHKYLVDSLSSLFNTESSVMTTCLPGVSKLFCSCSLNVKRIWVKIFNQLLF